MWSAVVAGSRRDKSTSYSYAELFPTSGRTYAANSFDVLITRKCLHLHT